MLYTVYVQWFVIGKRGNYLRRVKRYCNIRATGMIEAGDIALSYHMPYYNEGTYPSVSMVWSNWPQ